MNEILNGIQARRSCRSYEDRPVPREVLEEIVRAGTFAPSAMGRQPGKIVVLRDKEEIAKLEKMNAAIKGNPDGLAFYGAPVVLVVLAEAVPTAVEDGSLIMGNLLLAAHSLGLGSCWIHRAKEEFDSPEGKALLKEWGIEGEYVGIGHCILGYPAEELGKAKDRKADFVIWR